jgi:TfoX/Sxy family transcriptional regulator of competence genes
VRHFTPRESSEQGVKGNQPWIPPWTKAPEALVALFGAAIEGLPEVEPKKMFGYPAASVNGNMFTCLFQSSMIVRLSEQDRRETGAKVFEPVPGRPMREYVVVPEGVLRSVRVLDTWLRKGHRYASSLTAEVGSKEAITDSDEDALKRAPPNT